jgi:hypothetical protein
MKYLLDTDHLSILQRQAGRDYSSLATLMAHYPLSDFAVSTVTFHEQLLKRFLNLPCNTWWADPMNKMKRDIQGKFAIKSSDYREVRSLRLTDDTWKALGIASECLGLTRADYLEEIVSSNLNPCITWENSNISTSNAQNFSQPLPSITRYEQEIPRLIAQVENLQKENLELKERSAINFVHDVVDFEAIRDRILFDLKLGQQASAYKAAQKALNQFIQEIKHLVDSF